jgi:hypothetical protein
MADQWVRLGMAIVIIALISIGLYQFSARAGVLEPHIAAHHVPVLNIAPAPVFK